jgi:predicted  nucleic acid-binding Zn-ribbon protein
MCRTKARRAHRYVVVQDAEPHPDGKDNEKRELQKALRAAKSDATKREEEVTDLKEELAALKQSSKEREEKWKAKAKEAIAERDRLADVEVSAFTMRSIDV